jgi:predicted amidophosphoribosyltransferase
VVFRTLAGLALPARCASCDAWGASPLCADCLRTVAWIGHEACARCGAPAPCRLCTHLTFAFDGAACAAPYDGPIAAVLKAFKLGGERRLARPIAAWLLDPARGLSRPDAIAWVPSTRRGVAERGFDPAGMLAGAFARLVDARAVPLLSKIRETADQAGLGRAERVANLKGAFRCRPAPRTMLIVDDILTTGATADACALAARQAGARRVDVLTVARSL